MVYITITHYRYQVYSYGIVASQPLLIDWYEAPIISWITTWITTYLVLFVCLLIFSASPLIVRLLVSCACSVPGWMKVVIQQFLSIDFLFARLSIC